MHTCRSGTLDAYMSVRYSRCIHVGQVLGKVKVFNEEGEDQFVKEKVLDDAGSWKALRLL